jgi:hypothetical protein
MTNEMIFQMSMQALSALAAVFGGYMAIRVELVKITMSMKAVKAEIERIDRELLRIRESVDGRKYGR